MRRLYRIYYDSFDPRVHRRVLAELRSKYGVEVVDHESRVNPEFHYVELLLEEPGREEEIESLVREVVGSSTVKVDWIDTSS